MRLPLLLNLSLVLFALQNASAQLLRADDYFNSGAQFYISNSIPHALEKVESGLKVYPDNEKLKKLEELLKQQQQSQQNQQQQKQDNQQSKQNQKQDQQQKQDQKDQQSQSDQQKQDKQDQQQKQQQGQQGKQDEQKPEQKEGEPQKAQAGQMTPQEAQKLLDAQKGDEKVLQFKPDGKPQDVNRPIKDW